MYAQELHESGTVTPIHRIATPTNELAGYWENATPKNALAQFSDGSSHLPTQCDPATDKAFTDIKHSFVGACLDVKIEGLV